MKTSINLLLWTAHTTTEHVPLISELKELGFDGVELPVFAPEEADYQAVGAELDKLGMGRTGCTVLDSEASPTSPDPAMRAHAVETLKTAVELLCGRRHRDDGRPLSQPARRVLWQTKNRRAMERSLDVIREVSEHATSVGVKLALEPLNRFECYLLNTMEDTVRFVREVDEPSCKILYDTFHANIEEPDVKQAILAGRGLIGHVHTCENNRGTPGTGTVRWDDTFDALFEIGYDGWLTTEAFGSGLPEIAAAARVWRPLFPSEMELAKGAVTFVKQAVASRS